MIAKRLSEFRTRLAIVAFAVVAVSAISFGQIRGGGGSSTSRIVSPTVVASWRAHENFADGSTTTLLVLWRGTPGWFTASGRGSSGGGGGSSSPYAYEYMTYGGRTFVMEFNDDKKIVKIVNQEISLKDTNVVLVDFVDNDAGATIVGYRWVEPGPPAPLVAGAAADPIADVIIRSPELYEYLRCDLKVPDPLMNAMMPVFCGMMRGERVLPSGLAPR